MTPFKCKWGVMSDGKRRPDVAKPKWTAKMAGPAVMSHRKGAFGIAEVDPRPTQLVTTEQGPIVLGRGPVSSKGWMPSVADLESVPYADTRRTAISDRYYR